jgi:hypothetical protein
MPRHNLTDTHLTIWTVYRNPTDYPGLWVLRPFDVGPEGVQPRTDCVVADTLGKIREALPPGLHRVSRDQSDYPAIYESWV